MKRPTPLQRLAHRFLMLRPVSAFLVYVLHHVDNLLLKITGGKFTVTEIVGLPVIQLTSIGAKTGKPRSLPLVGLFSDEKILLIGSNLGQNHNPSWYYNLKANPKCSVLYKGSVREYLSREAQGEERDRYWQLAVSWYAGYEKYQQRVSRLVPIMVLAPLK